VRAWLAAAEASLLRSLVGQVMTLVAAEDKGTSVDELELLFSGVARWRRPHDP